MRHHSRFYIGGEWVEALSSQSFELCNPATEEPYATVSLGSRDDVDRAVQAARAAFPSFSALSVAERIALIENVIRSYGNRLEDLAAALTAEIGAPKSLKAQSAGGLEHLRQAIHVLQSYHFETRLGPAVVRREPIGVCSLILPWNWPIQTACIKIAAALAAGCTMVFKPSEYSPLSAVILAEIMHDAGVPPGVFNLVIGDGPTVGEALASHPDVDFVSFTGSTRAGILVAQAAATTVKRVSQELGGKSANIILPDADLEKAARWTVARGLLNSGQSCHSPTRILVHRDQHDDVVRHMTDVAARVQVGDPNDIHTTMGPVVNRAQFNRVQDYIKVGIDEGARPVVGGLGRPAGLNSGFYVRPTIFTDVDPSMTIAQEEIFGPVLAVIPYRDEEEAIQIANGTVYGLAGYLFTSSAEKARTVSEQLRAGRVFYDGAAGHPAAPMGGYKQSGNGREVGVFGLEEYLEVKAMFGFDEAGF